ncbi:hypothetical protein Clacol_006674 [Clathrus columnatus]|uniref:Phosphoglucomutase n=1 Tax=Clathrus columnatus TaxID=1419009 RepID=A0AAV5AFJ9_9AGAM|nr:hypothetical protein Clacol_006674 [Clathrus columnatus]
MSNKSLEDLVKEWLRLDREEHTRKEIERLWASKELSELEKRLRGRMEAGFARMNSLIVIQVSQGLATYLIERIPAARSKGVVIGRDHRRNSEHWAELTQAVFLNYGFVVYSLPGFAMTPLVPFTLSKLKAAAGVMITASHNPKDDNGYKVYWENAVQIISPHDAGIAEAIANNLEPRVWGMKDNSDLSLLRQVPSEILESYFSHIVWNTSSREINSSTQLKFVNTSMHGVSHVYISKAFETVGLPLFIPVESQMMPDPEFPTVKFPNPEEKGELHFYTSMIDSKLKKVHWSVLRLVYGNEMFIDKPVRRTLLWKKGNKELANYILAQDPDADRFIAAERLQNGEWKVFSGDMLGAIFAARTLEIYVASGRPLDCFTSKEKLAMVASTVSSKMLKAIADQEGFKFVDCLTGFKYIGNTVLDLVKQGYEVPFGYEEAIGFMIGSEIRDKDGVSATIFFAELAVELEKRGMTVSQYLTSLYDQYGYFEVFHDHLNFYYVCNSPSIIDTIFTRLRNYETSGEGIYRKYPREIGGLKTTWIRDLTMGFGYDSEKSPTFLPELPLSSGQMIQFKMESSSGSEVITLTLRTSGTEPKIKYYLEGQGKILQMVKNILGQVVEELTTDWMQAAQNGLTWPEQ